MSSKTAWCAAFKRSSSRTGGCYNSFCWIGKEKGHGSRWKLSARPQRTRPGILARSPRNSRAQTPPTCRRLPRSGPEAFRAAAHADAQPDQQPAGRRSNDPFDAQKFIAARAAAQIARLRTRATWRRRGGSRKRRPGLNLGRSGLALLSKRSPRHRERRRRHALPQNERRSDSGCIASRRRTTS